MEYLPASTRGTDGPNYSTATQKRVDMEIYLMPDLITRMTFHRGWSEKLKYCAKNFKIHYLI